MSDFAHNSNATDPFDDEVQQALLAAFGEDAMDLLNEDLDQLDPSKFNAVNESESLDDPSPSLEALLDDLSQKIEETHADRSDAAQIELEDEDESSVDLGPRHVVFEVSDQQYGIPLDGVLEIDRCGKVTSLPRTPDWLRGVTNLRGEILSVTDFRDLLGLADQRRIVGEKIIVVHSERHDARTALVVDRVLGIRNLRGEQGPLEGLSDRLAVFADSLSVTDQATTVLIDPDRLLGSNELSAFAIE